ncbi:MAG: hypothetical protein HYY97_12385 [Rhodocyclales bacterium]|nr:hypothetical protein [Rhodocyclales bacterium]
MDLDALAGAIRQTSSDPIALKLSDLLISWKDDKSNATELERDIERYIGNTWIASTTEHEQIYSLWSQFRDDAIHGIGGMTMNERLYCFGLFPRWDNSHTEEERKVIYAKLLANP